MKSKVPSPYVHSLCASSISNRTFGGTLENSCQGGPIESSRGRRPSHTIPVVLEIGLSLSVSYVYSRGFLPCSRLQWVFGSLPVPMS